MSIGSRADRQFHFVLQRHVRMVSLFGSIEQCSYCTPPKALYSGVSTVLSTKKAKKGPKKVQLLHPSEKRNFA
jgi:hypothetical protein